MEPLNPVTLEQEMAATTNSIAKSILEVSKAYDAWKTAELAYKREYAVAYRVAKGSVEDRKQKAIEDTLTAADDLKDAEVKYRYVADLQRMYRDKLSAYQTLARSVNAAYGAAGVGER